MNPSRSPNEPVIEDRLIILPCDPEFHQTIGQNLPPGWVDESNRIGYACRFVVSPETGLMRPVTNEELDEYLYGGEYDERLEQIGQADGLA